MLFRWSWSIFDAELYLKIYSFNLDLILSETVACRHSVKRCCWKFRKIHRKTPVPEAWALQLYQKRNSGTGVFLWILRNFQERPFIEHLWWLLLPFIFLHANDKLVIAQYLRAILANILLVSHILMLFHSPKGLWNKWQITRNF